MKQPAPPAKSLGTRWAVAVLVMLAVIGTLWVPIYARATPKLGPFPFFYWYQFVWVPVSSALCWLGYLMLRAQPAADGHEGARR